MESMHFLLMKAQVLLQHRIYTEAAGLGLSPGQPKILEYLSSHEGSDQKTIAAYCEIEQATVGSILLRMENSGLIERRQQPGNRRSLFVYLTENGRRAAQKLESVFADAEQEALQSFSEDEKEQFRSSLDKICYTLKGGIKK